MTQKQRNAERLVTKIAAGVLAKLRVDFPHTTDKRLYSLREGARYLGRSLSAIEKLVHTGELPSIKNGARRLLDVRDLDKWIDAGRVQ